MGPVTRAWMSTRGNAVKTKFGLDESGLPLFEVR